jgi:hypothetical protein
MSRGEGHGGLATLLQSMGHCGPSPLVNFGWYVAISLQWKCSRYGIDILIRPVMAVI